MPPPLVLGPRPRSSTRPCRTANRAAWVRSVRWSLLSTAETWVFTVFSATNSRAASSLFDSPSPRSASTSRSRAVSWSRPASWPLGWATSASTRPATAGSSTEPPRCTVRMADSSSLGGTSLPSQPLAPAAHRGQRLVVGAEAGEHDDAWRRGQRRAAGAGRPPRRPRASRGRAARRRGGGARPRRPPRRRRRPRRPPRRPSRLPRNERRPSRTTGWSSTTRSRMASLIPPAPARAPVVPAPSSDSIVSDPPRSAARSRIDTSPRRRELIA